MTAGSRRVRALYGAARGLRPLALLLLLSSVAFPALGADAAGARARELLAARPLRFEQNLGQTDPQALYLSRHADYTLFLTRDGAVLSLRAPGSRAGKAGQRHPPSGAAGSVIRLRFLDSSDEAEVEPHQPLGGPTHYLIGSGPSTWRTDVPSFSRVEYREVYPGVGLAFYGSNDRHLEYDVTLEPGADLAAVRLGIEGARRLLVDADGHLLLETDHGTLVQRAPFVYQDVGDLRRVLPSRYVLRGEDEVGFAVDGYDPNERLVLDPVLTWSTYLGGTNDDGAEAIVASTTSFYVTGYAWSSDFPTVAAIDSSQNGSSDAFITRFPIAGGAPVFSTYLGGSGSDIGQGLYLDTAAAQLTIVGKTNSSDFPRLGTPSPAQGALGGGFDAFVTRLSISGSLVYSTYLGGQGDDEAWDVYSSSGDRAHVVGRTASALGFPITALTALQATYQGGASDAFLTRLTAGGNAFDFSTYLGGSGDEAAYGMSLENSGALACTSPNPCFVIAGETSSLNFPVQAALYATYRGGGSDGFITKFNTLPVTSTPATLRFSTYFGGSARDALTDVKSVTNAAEVYVVGSSDSDDLPVLNAYQPLRRGGTDAVAAALDRTGALLRFSTYFGGSADDLALGIGYSSNDFFNVAGTTSSPDFPQVDPLQAGYGGGASDGFLVRFAPQACAVSFSTFVGGSDGDRATDVSVTGATTLAVAGDAGAGVLTTVAAFQPGFQGGVTDAWVRRIEASALADLLLTKSDSPDPVLPGAILTYTLTVTNQGPSAATNVVLTDTLPGAVTFISSSPGAPVCNFSAPTLTCALGCMDTDAVQTVTLQVQVATTAPITITNTANVTSSVTDPSPNTVIATTSVTQITDLDVVKAVSAAAVLTGASVTYDLTVRNDGPSNATGVILTDVLPAGLSFVSASPPCTHSTGTVTCVLGALPALGAPLNVSITTQAITPGTWDNSASAAGTGTDPDGGVSNVVSVVVSDPPERLPVLAATSTGGPLAGSGRNLLQWTNPAAGGPYSELRIRWNESTSGTSDCTFPGSPTGPSDGVFNLAGPPVGGKFLYDDLGLELNTAYCYTAWTIVPGPFYSTPMTVKARPFDATGKVRWAYATGATSVVAPGISPGGILTTVSNDGALHEMWRDGANPGEWPAAFLPPGFGFPSQSRPPVVPTTIIGGSSRITYLSSQNGVAHAVDADTGAVKWDSPSLGTGLQGALAGMFVVYGGSVNQVFVGTWNSSTDNRLYALDAATGAPIGAPFDNLGGANGIGVVSSGAAVDYPGNKVYFTSRLKVPGPGAPETVWCMNITAGGLTPAWKLAGLGDIDVAPVLRNGRLYVASLNTIYSLDVSAPGTFHSRTLPAGENVKGFLFPDRDSTKVYFSTTNKVWGFDDQGPGPGFVPLWPEVTLPTAGPPNNPSIALYARGTPYLYVGGSDGKLWQLDMTGAQMLPVPIAPLALSVTLGAPAPVVGAPSLDTLVTPNLVYVGTEEGVVYAVEVPLP